MMKQSLRCLVWVLIAGATSLLGPGPVARAQAVSFPPAAGLPTVAEFMPLAEEADLKAEAETARASEMKAKDSLGAERDLEADARSRLTASKAMLDGLKKQIDLANKEKRDADKKALEAERKNEESTRNFFECLLALRQAELEFLDATMESERSRAVACDRGVALGAQRRKSSDTKSVTSSAQISSLDSNLASAEKQYLESTRTWMERADNAAGKNKTAAERRMQAWEALRNVRR